MNRLLSLLSLCAVLPLWGTDYRPWTFRDLELNPRVDYLYQHYSKINSASGSKHETSNDHFLTFGLAGSYTVYTVEGEVQFVDSEHRSAGFDHGKITGKYHLCNDIVGDAYSLAIGASLSGVDSRAVRDISSFHHGEFEAQVFATIGKEETCFDYWVTRKWGVAGIGIANRGSPWFFSELAWEKNGYPYQWGLFGKLLWGFGDRSLHIHHFHGYGSVEHRSIDLGARILYETECSGYWLGELTQRVWAYNFPAYATKLQISFIYPFGL